MQVIIVWNDITAKVPEHIIRALPKEQLFLVRPKHNSLQNVFLPMDLIRTDAVLTIDDDVRISNFDLSYAFRQERALQLTKTHFIPVRFINKGMARGPTQQYWFYTKVHLAKRNRDL